MKTIHIAIIAISVPAFIIIMIVSFPTHVQTITPIGPVHLQDQNSHTLPANTTGCDTPYPKGSGIPVLFMPTNSSGKICVIYPNPNSPPFVPEIREAQSFSKIAENVTITGILESVQEGNSTVDYTIHSANKAGFFRLLITCIGMQLAIGYNQSNIVQADFPYLGGPYYCPVESDYPHITGTSGIGVTFLPYS